MATKRLITCANCGMSKLSFGDKYCSVACMNEHRAKKHTEAKLQEDGLNDIERQLIKTKGERDIFVRRYQELQARVAEEDTFLERCIEHLDALKALPPWKPPKQKYKFTKQSMVLLLSDTQIGEKFIEEDTGLYSYNLDIFKKRLEYLFKKTVLITDMHRSSVPIDDIHILTLGDIIENESIYKGQGGYIEEGVLDQFFHAIEYISNFFRSIAGHFKTVYVPCIQGNHGRINDTSRWYTNWDYLLYRFLESHLRDIPNIQFIIPKAWWMVHQVEGWKFYMTHGNTIPRYMSIPWYGLERMDGRITKMLQAKKIDYDYLVFGHHHNAFDWDSSHGERICNGSFNCGNVFAAKELALSTRPTQMLFGVHPHIGITFRYKIRLDASDFDKE